MEINKAWLCHVVCARRENCESTQGLFTHPWGIKMATWINIFVQVRWTILDAIVSSPQISTAEYSEDSLQSDAGQVTCLAIFPPVLTQWTSLFPYYNTIDFTCSFHAREREYGQLCMCLMARPGSGTYYHCPHPFWSQPDTKGDWEMLSRIQEKDMELVSISLVCLKS